ncbi:MAG: erythromycin esterase family protein [Rhodospirillaceae bacterium]
MRSYAFIAALLVSTSALGALPGVVEIRKAPEAITDAELSASLQVPVDASDVVAIGESIHGSSVFLRIQARLIRYLVERHGFRLIVWENPTLRSVQLGRWLSACTATKTAVPVDVLYMPTAADVPLWEWLCDYNREHPSDPVVFRGMDVWDRPWEHYARIESLSGAVGIASSLVDSIKRYCPVYGTASWREIAPIYERLQRDGRFLPQADYERCRAALTDVFDRSRAIGIEQNKTTMRSGDDAFELALSASTLLGWLGFYNYNWSDDILSWNERDRAQGRNLVLLMEKHRASRAVLSAHTSHVSHNRSQADWWGYGDLKSGVFFFAAMTGKRVFNIALTAYEASGTQGDWLTPTAANSLDKKLHDAGHVFSFFLSNAPFLTEHPTWWMQNGNAAGMENGIELVPRDHFDAFYFIDRSPLDKALPARSMWEP